ncbi:MAG: flagellar basal body L-ring protein [Cereibacter sphaeroides]|uniref:Flagellar L-ring protein n=1 Tax=Cereibacter sphaeroides TaxID=1063 RepID=A0A2W5S7Z0_CERSP|nr:MAG: flagellar basal body L-ring protein [Cereibacter sphaeroides]
MAGTLLCLMPAAACGRLADVGRAPSFSDMEGSYAQNAMYSNPLPLSADPAGASDAASLWTAAPSSLLGDRRAERRGDILTVVIEIDEKAEISNSTGRERDGEEEMGVADFYGIPQRINRRMPEGASMDPAVKTSSSSSYAGKGTVKRKEKLTLRIAATVIDELPNGVLRLEGQQEVRVNFELRELTVTGYVRSADISRQNEITYDKIAGARISYGGRGQISDVQQPRYGQQLTDILLPF